MVGTTIALAASGDLDTSFSTDGQALIDFGSHDYGRALLVQPGDGKYVLAGMATNGLVQDFAVARVLP